jgi:hypothetical protein
MASVKMSERLDSWKEIAAYLKRDERTVQRWERERSLPVHRVEGKRRDLVIAYTGEIDAWLEGHPKLLSHSENEAADPSSNSLRADYWRSWVHWRTFAVVAALGLIVGVAAWRLVIRSAGEPDRVEVQGDKLTAYDKSGRKLWDYSFGFPLDEIVYRARGADFFPRRENAVLRDLDGDGHAELVFVAVPTTVGDADRGVLACFDHRGKLRWSYTPRRTVHFGNTAYEPPYFVDFFRLSTGDGSSGTAIWLVAHHIPWFPAVVTKLDAEGKPLAEYWHGGHIDTLAEAKVAGRRELLIGAVNNENSEAALSAVDFERPAGRSPAETSNYRCQDCPPNDPLAYLLFPASTLGRVIDQRPAVYEIRTREAAVDVAIRTGTLKPGVQAEEHYTLDTTMGVQRVEVGGAYQFIYDDLRDRGRIKQPFDHKAELQRMGRVRYWDGQRFAVQSTNQASLGTPHQR